MTPWQLEADWPGYATLGRRMALGRTTLGRSFGALAAGLAIAIAVLFAGAEPAVWADVVVIITCAAVAGICSAQVTGTAADAQRIFALAMAPLASSLNWRRGWLQAQAALTLTLATGSTAVVALHAGLGWELVVVPGCIIAAQALGAWTSMALHGRVWSGWLLAPWIVVALGGVAVQQHWVAQGGVWLAASLGIGALLTALPALAAVHRRLGPLVRTHGVAPPRDLLQPMRRHFARWTPVGGNRQHAPWQPVFSLLGVMILGTLVSSTYLPARLYMLAYLAGICTSLLVTEGLHWRRLLAPGAARRDRLGRQLFWATLRMYAVIIPPLALIAAGLAWATGMSTAHLMSTALAQAIPLLELVVATAVATALSAVFMGRLKEMRSWLLIAAAAIVIIAALVILRPWRADSPCAAWPRAGLGYALALLPLGLASIALADRLWSHRDLNALLRRPPSRPFATALGY